MAGFAFRPNSVFEWNGARFRVREITATGQVLLVEEGNDLLTIVDQPVLLSEFAAGRLYRPAGDAPATNQLVFSRPLDELAGKVRKEAARRLHYLKAICAEGIPVFTRTWMAPLLKQAAAEIGDPDPPGSSTVYRWYRRHQATGGDTRSLIPRYDRRGPKNYRQPERVLALLKEATAKAFEASPQATGVNIYSRLVSRINAENNGRLPGDKLRAPTLRTVYRHLGQIEIYDQIALREGKASADRRLKIRGGGPRPTRILERVEIDHTPMDLFVIDERTWLPLGRPTLTIALDKFSRMVVGYYLSFSAPSAAAVVGALRHAILPKERKQGPLASLTIENDWPCYGIPETLVADNGLEFHGIDLGGIALDLGITLQYCEAYTPNTKGSVERFLKTVNYHFVHQLPGTSFARFYQRGDYDSTKHALLTFAECKQFVEKWLLDVYSASIHSATKTTPLARWREGLAVHTPELPSSLALLQQRIGMHTTRRLRKGGFELNGFRYSDPSMGPILRRYGESVSVRVVFDPEDLGYVQVWGPDDNEPVQARAVEFEMARGLTMKQSELLRQMVREKGKSVEDAAALQQAREALTTEIEALMTSRKLSERRRSAALRGISSSKPQSDELLPTVKKPSTSKRKTETATKPGLPASLPSPPQILKAFRMIQTELPDGDR